MEVRALSKVRPAQVSGVHAAAYRAILNGVGKRSREGQDLLAGISGKSELAKRCRGLVDRIIDDHGGSDRCSEVKIQLIRRFATASVLAEAWEQQLVSGKDVEIEHLHKLVLTLVRLSQRLGVGLAVPVVTQSLSELMRDRDGADLDAELVDVEAHGGGGEVR